MSSMEVNGRSSRACAERRCAGIGVNQISASSPIWWEECPDSIGPPRGWEMSPMRMPEPQPSRTASCENFSSSSIIAGLPQRRFRDSRIACQVGPSVGIATAPAMQPLA